MEWRVGTKLGWFTHVPTKNELVVYRCWAHHKLEMSKDCVALTSFFGSNRVSIGLQIKEMAYCQ